MAKHLDNDKLIITNWILLKSHFIAAVWPFDTDSLEHTDLSFCLSLSGLTAVMSSQYLCVAGGMWKGQICPVALSANEPHTPVTEAACRALWAENRSLLGELLQQAGRVEERRSWCFYSCGHFWSLSVFELQRSKEWQFLFGALLR